MPPPQTTAAPRIPHLIFIARSPALLDAWRRAIDRYFPSSSSSSSPSSSSSHSSSPSSSAADAGAGAGAGAGLFTVRAGRLEDLPPAEIAHECVVSPANAFGIMDGGFDLALSHAFRGPSADVYFLTDHVQTQLRARWAGYAPPGSCTLVPLPAAVRGAGRNAWGTHTVAVVPTMKRPEEVGWQRELVYGAMWGVLCEVGRWNARARADAEAEAVSTVTGGAGDSESDRDASGPGIWRILMTGLGTGAGGVSAERCAAQMVLAVKHYAEAGALPERVRWESEEVRRRVDEIEETVAL